MKKVFLRLGFLFLFLFFFFSFFFGYLLSQALGFCFLFFFFPASLGIFCCPKTYLET